MSYVSRLRSRRRLGIHATALRRSGTWTSRCSRGQYTRLTTASRRTRAARLHLNSCSTRHRQDYQPVRTCSLISAHLISKWLLIERPFSKRRLVYNLAMVRVTFPSGLLHPTPTRSIPHSRPTPTEAHPIIGRSLGLTTTV